ncbi:MAG TPA: hypothetical protein VGU64_07705 [Terriglobales bacterium]|nr:hypothetical protein [Terriglobales bacterium]
MGMSLSLKPSHATVKAYYETLGQFGQLYIDHEGAVRSAFQTLLAKCGQKASPKLTLVPEYRIERARSSVIVDGALVDLYHLPHGYWEAKDEKDDLAREVQRKLDKGYPRDSPHFDENIRRATDCLCCPSPFGEAFGHPQAPDFHAYAWQKP